MNSEIQELIRICEQLPEGNRNEAADFARFLLAEQDDAEGQSRFFFRTPVRSEQA